MAEWKEYIYRERVTDDGVDGDRMGELVRCRECQYFEQDHFDGLYLDGVRVPIITAHEICTQWGNGCKTDRNGYCFMGVKMDEVTDGKV